MTLFPVYLAAFFAYTGLLEGLSPGECVAKAQRSIPPALVSGSVFWPVANVANFMWVPPSQRLPFVAGAGILWNAALAYLDARDAAAAGG